MTWPVDSWLIPSRKPWSCMFRNWSRLSLENVYLSDTRIYLTLKNLCKCQILNWDGTQNEISVNFRMLLHQKLN